MFLGPAVGRDGRLELVETLAGRGYPRERHRQRTRVVVDDYGDAVMYERRCPLCLEWLPLTLDHFDPEDNPRARIRMQAACRPCQVVDVRMRLRRRSEEVNAKRRAAYHAAKSTPEGAARVSRQKAEAARRYKERDVERWRRLRREASRRWRARVMADPERRRWYRENQRIDRAARASAEGRPVPAGTPTGSRGRGDLLERVDPRPLAWAIWREVERERADGELSMLVQFPGRRRDSRYVATCERCRVDPSKVRRWLTGADPLVSVDLADRVLLGLGLEWWDVYDPDEWPGTLSPLLWLDVVDDAARAFEGEGWLAGRC